MTASTMATAAVTSGDGGAEPLGHQVPGPATDVVVAGGDPAPAEGGQQGSDVVPVGPELEQVRPAFAGVFLEGLEQPEPVSLMALRGHDTDVQHVRHTPAEDIPQSPDPITDLIRQDQVPLLGGAGIGGGQVGKLGGELLALHHLADGQVSG